MLYKENYDSNYATVLYFIMVVVYYVGHLLLHIVYVSFFLLFLAFFNINIGLRKLSEIYDIAEYDRLLKSVGFIILFQSILN